MSDNSTFADLAQQAISGASTTLTSRHFTVAAAALVFYDYFLMFSLEKSEIWTGKFNLTKLLFVGNRYSSLMFQFSLVFLYFFTPATNTTCAAFYYLENIFQIILSLSINSIFILRTFAIFGKSWIIFSIVSAPALILVIADIVDTVAQSATAYPVELQVAGTTCNFTFKSALSTINLVNLVAATLFEALVVSLTMFKTLRLALQSRKLDTNSSLSFVLLRDGIFYYAVIFLPTFANVALNSLLLETGIINLYYAADNLAYLSAALQIVMVNRLILNLRKSANSNEDSTFRTRTALEPPMFAANPVLGNIGEPMRTVPDENEDLSFGSGYGYGADSEEIRRSLGNDVEQSFGVREGVDMFELSQSMSENEAFQVGSSGA